MACVDTGHGQSQQHTIQVVCGYFPRWTLFIWSKTTVLSKAKPSSRQKLFLPFFLFSFASSYVGYVPASNDLGICCFVWQCEFLSKFLFITDEKSTFHRKVFGGPRSPKTTFDLGDPKVIYQNFWFMAVAAILLGLSNLSNLYKHCANNSYCQFSSNNSHHCLIIHGRMSSLFPPPPKVLPSLNLPVQLLAPPALPSLGECFPCGSVDLGKYFLYSSALSWRARWRTLLTMSVGGSLRY